MIQELLYTSAPKGLKPGSRGFCTVLSTSGMPAPVATALEALSGYRPVYPPDDPRAARNPVVFSYMKMSLSGRRSDVFSRIADYGLDYSQRTNKLAHHLVIDASDRPQAGPAWLLAHSGMMRNEWNGELQVVSGERSIPSAKSSLQVCSAWADITGDAGWAGVLAEAFLKHPEQPAYIIFAPGMNLLPLIEEAITLLPVNRRWDVTFSTYFTKIPNRVTCNWRCLLADSPEAKESRRYVQSLRIDLTADLPKAVGGPLVEGARTGVMPIEISGPPSIAPQHKAPSIEPPADETGRRVRPAHLAPPRLRSTPNAPAEQRSKSRTLRRGRWVAVLAVLGAISAAVVIALAMRDSSKIANHSQAPLSIAPEPATTENPGRTAPPEPSPPVPVVTDAPAPAMPPATAPAVSPPGDASTAVALKSMETPTPATPTAASNPAPQVDVGYLGIFENGIKNGDPKTFHPIELSNLQVTSKSIWVPVDCLASLRAKGANVERKDQLEGKWTSYLTIDMDKAKDGDKHSEQVVLSANNIAEHKDICRFVLLVESKSPDHSVKFLLHQSPEVSKSKAKFGLVKLGYSVVAPQISNTWILKLKRIAISNRKMNENLVPGSDTNSLPMKWTSNQASIQFEVDAHKLIDTGELMESDSIEFAKVNKPKLLLTVKVAPHNVDQQMATTEVEVEVNQDPFWKTMRDVIAGDIGNSTIAPASIPCVSQDWNRETVNISESAFTEHIVEKRKRTADFRSDRQRERDSLSKEKKEKGDTDPNFKSLTNILEEVDNQLGRLDRIIVFAKSAQRIAEQLKKIRLQELEITQECQNGDDTRDLPIFFYQHSDSTPNK